MTSPFKTSSGASLAAPAGRWVPVTASDTLDLPDGVCRALLVGTAGAADIIDADGVARSAVPLQAGYNPGGVQRVKATSLTAANIWALYDITGEIHATTQVLHDGSRNCIMLLTGRADGSADEEGVVKVNLSQLAPRPTRVKMRSINYNVQGGVVELAWQADDPIAFAQLEGQAELAFPETGGIWNNAANNVTGNILLTTRGFGGGSSYCIALKMTKHYKSM